MLSAFSTISIQCYSKSDAAHYLPKNADEQTHHFGSCQPLFQKYTSLLCTAWTASDQGTCDTTGLVLFFCFSNWSPLGKRSWHFSSAGCVSPQLRLQKSMKNTQNRMLVAKGLLHRSNNILTILTQHNRQNFTPLPERCFFYSLEEFPRQKNAQLKLKKSWAPDICINFLFISSPNTHPQSTNPSMLRSSSTTSTFCCCCYSSSAVHLVNTAYHTKEEGMPLGTTWQHEQKVLFPSSSFKNTTGKL